MHLIDIFKAGNTSPENLLIRYDVTYVFTQIPTTEALAIINKMYKPKEHVIKQAYHSIKKQNFI